MSLSRRRRLSRTLLVLFFSQIVPYGSQVPRVFLRKLLRRRTPYICIGYFADIICRLRHVPVIFRFAVFEYFNRVRIIIMHYNK